MTQQPEHVEDPWAGDPGPAPRAGDRFPAARRRGDGQQEQHDRGGDGGAEGGGGHVSFERVPPQDLEAEQSVLGGMLLSKDAIADVVEVLKGHDFYRPAHERVYQAVLDLYAKGEPADPITVTAELTKRGEISRVGGPGYVHGLVQTVPTAANAEYYAEIVHERAVLRRLVEAGTRITQMGYAADGDVDDIVNSAQSEIYAVTEQRTSEDYLPLGDIMEGALDEIEAIGSRSGQMTGVPTGFTDLDSLTNGLHPGQMIVIAARPAMGKALALDTPLPTPSGWTTMKDVQEGDRLLGADGRPTSVTAVTDVMYGRRCYEVTFDDGTTVTADAEHQWLTGAGEDAGARGGSLVRTTEEIADTFRGRGRGRLVRHAVRNAAPLELPERELPVPPEALGAWLGAALTGEDRAGGSGTAGEGVRTPGPAGQTEAEAAPDLAEVLGRPHIPESYLRASSAQRRALLRGLLEAAGTGGGPGRRGPVRLVLPGRALAESVRELVVGLGHACPAPSPAGSPTPAGAPEGTGTSARYALGFTLPEADSGCGEGSSDAPGRASGDVPATAVSATAAPALRHITGVRETASVPVRCVQVDSRDHLYLATSSMIPTHNSTLALDFARACSIRHNMPSVIFSLEMGRNEIAMRLLSAEARVALHHMRSGSMTDEDWTRLARQMPGVTDAPLYIDDSPNLSMMEIRAKCRRLKQRNDLKLIVIDYLQLMQNGSSRRPESRQQEVSEMSRNLKLLAKELEVPVIALSQLNRGPEQRTDKKPMVSDLRESGCVTADTRVLRADTGSEVTVGELLRSGERDIPVWSLDESLRLVQRTMTHVFRSGTKETFRLTLASGRQIEATANHPFLTYEGWTPLGELDGGTRVAVPRRTGAPRRTTARPGAELARLARELGEAETREAASEEGAHGQEEDARGDDGRRAYERCLPAWVFGLPEKQAASFVRELWTALGPVTAASPEAPGSSRPAADEGTCRLTASEGLARDLQLLLLRLDIGARLRRAGGGESGQGWEVAVCGADDQREFLARTGLGAAAVPRQVVTSAERLRGSGAAGGTGTGPGSAWGTGLDTVPEEVWDRVRELMSGEPASAPPDSPARSSAAVPEAAGAGARTARGAVPGRSRMAQVAAVLDRADVQVLGTSDVFWDEVVSVESLGERDVYDATVPGTHNFVANGIHIHNSIEQDADMVVLLHREDAYEKESPRAGEADLIVAKHRNGPTATITVAFQGHYSRFVDMAQT